MNAFRIALLTMLGVAAGVAAACGGGGDVRTAPRSSPIGSYNDANDFRSFAGNLDDALENRDLSFFLTNGSFHDVFCGEQSPAPPASCAAKAAGATAAAILVGVWEGEDYYLDEVGYEDFMLGFLTEHAAGVEDEYGGAEAMLYAYAVTRPEFQVAPPADEQVEAILTRISPDGTRESLLLTAGFNDERWAVTQIVVGPAAFLTPEGPEPPPGAALETIFEFWAPWK